MAKKTAASGSESFTDTARVKALIALMADNGLTEIELVEDKSRIVLRRGTVSGGASAGTGGAGHSVTHHAPVHTPAQTPAMGTAAKSAADADAGLVPIKSPMVGVFYSSPSPDSPPYVSVGSTVDAKTVVCTIESMKHFNPIAAETHGTIAKVLVANGQVVEFDQPLFLLRQD